MTSEERERFEKAIASGEAIEITLPPFSQDQRDYIARIIEWEQGIEEAGNHHSRTAET